MKLTKQSFFVFAGIIGFLIPFLIEIPGLSAAGHIALSIFIIAAVFWMSEPVPIYATSMLVITLQVFLLSNQGLSFTQQLPGYTPNPYTDFIGTLANPTIILFLGGFVLAAAAVKFDLDKNLTRILLKPFGTKPKFILLGLILSTALISAFMSNTATTAMMMTIIIPIMAKTDKADPFRIALTLSIPFAANIGGIVTPIGSPPNAITIGALATQGIPIAFTEWMTLTTPIVLTALLFCWLILIRLYRPATQNLYLEMSGRFPTNTSSIIVYAVFGITVLLWVTESLHGLGSGMVALIPIALLTLTGILDKDEIRKLPWEVLWLVAGGISLGISMENTGLAEWIINSINWSVFPSTVLILVFAAVGLAMSIFLSNTVTAALLIPLAISLSVSGVMGEGFNLVMISVVIGISVSMAMALPVSTPPNAIAMSTGIVKTSEMIKSGLLIGLVGIILVVLSAMFYLPLIIK